MAMSSPRPRVPAAERRESLIDAAVEEFAHGGLHGTPVDRIARRVGVAQPYVFSLFPTKRDLFIAAVERGFERVMDHFAKAPEPTLSAIADSYLALLAADPNLLTLQLHAYAAACEDETIAVHVRGAYAALVEHVGTLTGADADALDAFMAQGMWLNVQAAMGAGDLSAARGWVARRRESAEGEGVGGPPGPPLRRQ